MQRTGELVGRAVASVCNLLDLDLVVVGGSVALGFGATFFNSAQEALDRHSRLEFSRGARITPARLGDRGPLSAPAPSASAACAARAHAARADRSTVASALVYGSTGTEGTVDRDTRQVLATAR